MKLRGISKGIAELDGQRLEIDLDNLEIVSIANRFIISPYMEKPKTIDLITKRGLLPCVLLQMLCIISKTFIFALYVQLLK